MFLRIYNRLIMILNFFKYKAKYDKSSFLNKQNVSFIKFGLDRTKGKNLYNNLIIKHSFLNTPMSSEHNIIFCSLKFSKLNINNILEIGTYNGINAFLLSEIFPNSLIDTYDLPDDSLEFTSTYNRSDAKFLKKFISDRTKLLSSKVNIVFHQINSIYLSFKQDKTYDLIWIDGSHSYPVVSIDIMNSLRLINKNGVILCDDIILDSNNYNQYSSRASFETLSLLKDAGIIDFKLFYKRLSVDDNSIPNRRKFVAYIIKL